MRQEPVARRHARRAAKRGPRWAPLALFIASLPACSFGGSNETAGPEPDVVATPTTSVPQAEVLDAGASPRTARRFSFTAGTSTELSLLVDLSVEQEADGATQGFDTPAVIQQVTLTVVEVSADGKTAQVGLELGRLGLDPTGSDLTDTEVAELSRELDALVGLKGSGTVDDRGQVSDFEYSPPEGATARTIGVLDDAANQLAGITVPLPEDPIGVGARWRAQTQTVFGGVTATQETTYELIGVDGDRLTYRATVRQQASPGAITLGGLPAETTARIVSADLQGDTTGTADLRGLGVTIDSDLSGSQVVELTGPAGSTRTTQHLSLATRVEEVD